MSVNRSTGGRKLELNEDDDDEETEKEDPDKADENVSNIRERRFREFASIEYNGEIYMVILFYFKK